MSSVVAAEAHRRALARSVPFGRWLMLLVALAGLIAMHGFSDHGVSGSVEVSEYAPAHASSPTAGAVDTRSGPMSDASEVIVAVATNDRPARYPGGEHHGHESMLAGACLAVLGVTLALLLARRADRGLIALKGATLTLARAHVSALLAHSRMPRPPDLKMLSIQRC